jgi:hypothetical protein
MSTFIPFGFDLDTELKYTDGDCAVLASEKNWWYYRRFSTSIWMYSALVDKDKECICGYKRNLFR